MAPTSTKPRRQLSIPTTRRDAHTLGFGIGLALFAIVLWRHQMAAKVDRLLAALAALGSLTWNTETVSAFLLVGVGLVLVALSLRLDSGESAHRSATIG